APVVAAGVRPPRRHVRRGPLGPRVSHWVRRLDHLVQHLWATVPRPPVLLTSPSRKLIGRRRPPGHGIFTSAASIACVRAATYPGRWRRASPADPPVSTNHRRWPLLRGHPGIRRGTASRMGVTG